MLLLCCAVLLVAALTASAAPCAADRPAAGADEGMDVLRRAVDTAEEVSYTGVQAVSSTGPSGTEHRLVAVVHHSGGGTRVDDLTAGGADDAVLVTEHSPDRPGLDDRVLDAMEANYRVAVAGTGGVSGRAVTVVEALRANGTAAGRFWVDDATGLPLRRQMFDASGRVAHSAEFTDFDVVDSAAVAHPDAKGRGPGGDVLGRSDLESLRAGGWTLPERLSWKYRLMEVRTKEEGSEQVVHLSYTDGLSVISVFVQRGRLDVQSMGTAKGLRAVEYSGGTVYIGDAGQQRRMWEADEYVYTILAEAPRESVMSASASLPAPDADGFWDRVGRGFARFGDWAGL